MRKSPSLFAVALLTGIALVGCGTATTTGGATKVQTINVGFDTTFPPFETETNGQVTGFDVDLLKAIAAKENVKLNIQTMTFTGLIPGLQAHQIDVAAAGITIKQTRMDAVNFSNAYYKSGSSILIKKSDAGKIHSLADLKGKTVATKKGTSSVDILTKAGGITIKQLDNIDDAYNDLESGGAQAVVFDNPVNSNFAASHNDTQTVGDLLSGEYYGIAIDKSNSDLLNKINDGLQQLQKDGEFQDLYKKYFGDDKNGLVIDKMDPASVAVHDK